jgi:hypothetical protein
MGRDKRGSTSISRDVINKYLTTAEEEGPRKLGSTLFALKLLFLSMRGVIIANGTERKDPSGITTTRKGIVEYIASGCRNLSLLIVNGASRNNNGRKTRYERVEYETNNRAISVYKNAALSINLSNSLLSILYDHRYCKQ